MATEEKAESPETPKSEKFERVPETGAEEHEEHKPGVTSRIKERLENVKQEAREKIHEVKVERQKVSNRKKYLKQVETNAEREAEIEAVRESGKRNAQRKYGVYKSPVQAQTHKPAPHLRNAHDSLEFGLFGSAKAGSLGGGYYNIFGGSPPKKKPAPVRTTTYNPRTGKVTTTEPIMEKQNKAFEKKEKPWSPWDMVSGPELHVKGIPNQLNFPMVAAPAHKGHKKGKKGKHQTPHRKGYNIGDLIY